MRKRIVILSIAGLLYGSSVNAAGLTVNANYRANKGNPNGRLALQADTNAIVKIIYPAITAREGKGLNVPQPPAEHPRLYLTKKDLPAIKLKLASPAFKNCLDKLRQKAAFVTDGSLKPGLRANMDTSVRDAIEAKAFLCVLNNDKNKGREAVSALLNFYATLKIDMLKDDVTRDVGRCIVTGAMVYDWCYPELTAAEKALLIGRMETLATYMEVKWPALVQGSLVGHGVEAQLSRDLLSFGMAVYNEKPVVYNLVAGRIIAEFVPARSLFYPAGYHHQGSSYGPYRWGWDLHATLLFDKMGYPKIFGENQGKVPYFWLYTRRPDGQLLRNGDDFNELFTPFGKHWNINSLAYAGSYFKDPILMNEALKESRPGRGPDYLFDLLFLDNGMRANGTVSSLPLTKYFKEPLGAMVARTGWDEGLGSNAVVAEMKIGVRSFVNHEHLDAGSFQLYYKGPLAVQSGIYQGVTGGYASDHFLNYSQRSIAHNTMLFYDPAEQFAYGSRAIGNDGGQRYPNNGLEPKNAAEFAGKEYTIGEVMAHGIGPDSLKPEFSYLKGQLAPAYSKKVKSYTRSFVFLNLGNARVPAALIVFDNVITSNKEIKKYWLLHTVEEPAIKDSVTTVTRSGKGFEGKLVNTTLLPVKQNLIIGKIGGTGNEFNVFGKQYPQAVKNTSNNSADSAMWRLEVSPKKADTSNLFLNVMQVTGAQTQADELLPVKRVETKQLTGTQIGDRIVLFSRSGKLISSNFTLAVAGRGVFKVLIADVNKGNWTLDGGGGKRAIEVKDDKRYIYVALEPGSYKFSKKL